MNQNKDDYIKRIYHLGGQEDYISNKNLALELEVSPASVSEMIVRLEKDGVLEYIKYKGVRLTSKGRKRALFLVRAHRLWETFLASKLDYPWSDIHEDAELLEHASSEKLINHLDEFLGFPKYCPHGTPIPSKDGVVEQLTVVPLTEVPVNKEVKILQVTQDRKILSILEENNININDVLTVKKYNQLQDTLSLECHDQDVEIGLTLAKNIFVKGEER